VNNGVLFCWKDGVAMCLKQKFKLIKLALKGWHKRHARNLPARISSLKDRISVLEVKGKNVVLLDEEIEEMHGWSEELFSLSRINSSISWQQSRMQWLSEGDANYKFFHNIMSSKNRRNAIPFFLEDGVLVEGVERVRSAVCNHFSSHFRPRRVRSPSMEALHFRQLSFREGTNLTKPFSMEEVKAAVWDCDNYKSQVQMV